MVTTVADTLFNRLIDAFPANRDYKPDDFSREPMPTPVREFLEQRMAQRLRNSVHPEDDWIDVDHDDVLEAAERFRGVLAQHLRIPASAWRSELALACRTVISYLIRPAPTLTDLVFADGREDASVEDISEQFRFLSSYSYFEDVIGAYFRQKELDRISRERFAGLSRRIDLQMVRDFDTDEWMKLLQPLLDLVRQIPEFSRGIPVDVLKTFLDEKGADQLSARLIQRFESREVRFIRGADLRDFFENPEPEVADVEEASVVESAGPAVRQGITGQGSHVPLWKQFESGLRSPSDRDSAAESTGIDHAPSSRPAEAQPLWKQYHGSARSSAEPPGNRDSAQRDEPLRRHEAPRPGEPSAQKHRPDEPSSSEPARRLIADEPSDVLSDLELSVLGRRGQRNRQLFLRHLFSDSKDAYEATLRKLHAAESWSEASQIIAREVFIKHQVNIYSDPAVAFTDAAEARFRS